VPAQPRRQAPPPRIRIQLPRPTIEEGRWPIKRTVGDTVAVSADIFRDGHEVLRAVVRWRARGARTWKEAPLHAVDAHHNGVRWEGEFPVEKPGRTQWTIQAWVDLFAGWRDEVARKLEAGQVDTSGEASEGVVLLHDEASLPTTAVAAAGRLGRLVEVTLGAVALESLGHRPEEFGRLARLGSEPGQGMTLPFPSYIRP